MPERTAVSIGNFDGVHVGHAALLRRARELVGPPESGGRVVAMAFDEHPMTRLRPEAAPSILTSFEQRAELLIQCGADEVDRLKPTEDLLGLSPDAFVLSLIERHRPSVIVEGPDFRFGRARAGDVRTLAELGRRFDFDVDVLGPVSVTLVDQSIVEASSTMARWLIGHGRMRDATITLGRPYELRGVVVRGDRRGREIGCPTANIETKQHLPGDGVYAGFARLPDGSHRPAAISVGTKPTFGDLQRTAEAHVLDWEGPVPEGRPEYGWPIRVSFTSWIRDQVRYETVEALIEQIGRDIERTRRITDAEDASRTITREIPA
ncbi:MAG: bifunctional riboflavin kinase/FMN adenylyltransferase [Phycisphaeraceae bacterium]|nr:MAG: bifunctional riboflavin kinase/FMN adenylyltransferase [Phycisphaeraceae bacterium]